MPWKPVINLDAIADREAFEIMRYIRNTLNIHRFYAEAQEFVERARAASSHKKFLDVCREYIEEEEEYE